MLTIDEVAQKFSAKKNGHGYVAHCPAHKDENASLSIDKGRQGNILIKCHAGCTFNEVVAAVGIKAKELFPDEHAKNVKSKIKEIYNYHDAIRIDKKWADGELLYQVLRYEPKDFRQRKPDGKGGYEWKLGKTNRVLYRLAKVRNAVEAGRVVFIVEGEKDVHAIESLQCTGTTNSGGAGRWKKEYTKEFKNALVVIIADNDESGVGEEHAQSVAAQLKKTAKLVKLIAFSKKDTAEWVESGGTREKLKSIIDTAPEWTPETTLARKVSSQNNGAKGGRPPAPPHAVTANEIVQRMFTDKNGIKTLRYWRGSWYRYSEQGWHSVGGDEIQNIVITYLRKDKILSKHCTVSYLTSVLLNIRAHDLCGIPQDTEIPYWLDSHTSAKNWMAFNNGIVVNVYEYAKCIADNRGEDKEKWIRKTDANFFSLDFVKYPFDPDAECPIFEKFLDHVQPELDAQQAIFEMLGIMIADITKFEVFWQLYGHGSNGKTVLLTTLTHLVGERNVSAVRLEQLSMMFQTFPLALSKVNICGEMPTDIGRGAFAQVEQMFKDCVSGGLIDMQRKGKDRYEAKCRARFIMASNTLPTFIDRSDGIWRRLRILPFDVQIPLEERDADLDDKIIATDLPGVMNLAINGLAGVIKRGYVFETPSGEKMKEQHRGNCDHEKEFLDQNVELGKPDDKIKSKTLYNDYREWMLDNGYKPCGAGKFNNRVQEVFPGVEISSIWVDNTSTRGFQGIRFKISEMRPDEPDDDPQEALGI